MLLRYVFAATVLLAASLAPASARQLAVGAAAGYWEPPGYVARPVFTPPNGGSWQNSDWSQGYRFREPIYRPPPGYRYHYVRGYYWQRLPNSYARRTTRRPVKAASTYRARRGPCVTDNGYGRHENCGRFY